MWTQSYKGYFIHGYCSKPEVTYHREGKRARRAVSLHSAKIQITKRLNKELAK